MNMDLLHQMFHHLPEAVLVVSQSDIVYRNLAAQSMLPADEFPPQVLMEFTPDQRGEILVTHKDTWFFMTVSELDAYRLFMLRPQRETDPQTFPASIPARLRGHLSNLAVTTEQLADLLSKEEHFSEYHTLLSIQTQAIYRILRLAKQMELSVNDWELEYPRHTMDLGSLVRSISTELCFRKGELGPNIALHSEPGSLFILGSKPLLEQLILALISNAMKSAGAEGAVDLSLTQRKGRAILSVWNDGPGIPEDRLLRLFVPQHTSGLPRPNEGAGLDLWLAHRIALFHGGVIIAGNRPKGGSEFVLSLPITPPKSLDLKSTDQLPSDDGFSPVLIGLADALPRQAFDPLDS